MNKTITITSKGQFSLPVDIRRKLRLNEQGDTLMLQFDEKRGVISLSKPVSFAEMQTFAQKNARNKTVKIPEDIHVWYENERIKELKDRGVV